MSLVPSHLSGPSNGRGQPQLLDGYVDYRKQDHSYGRETLHCPVIPVCILSRTVPNVAYDGPLRGTLSRHPSEHILVGSWQGQTSNTVVCFNVNSSSLIVGPSTFPPQVTLFWPKRPVQLLKHLLGCFFLLVPCVRSLSLVALIRPTRLASMAELTVHWIPLPDDPPETPLNPAIPPWFKPLSCLFKPSDNYGFCLEAQGNLTADYQTEMITTYWARTGTRAVRGRG